MRVLKQYAREVIVGAVLMACGSLATWALATYSTNQAFAQHQANAGIHPNVPLIDDRLRKLEEHTVKDDQRWEQQMKDSGEIKQALGQIQGALNQMNQGDRPR